MTIQGKACALQKSCKTTSRARSQPATIAKAFFLVIKNTSVREQERRDGGSVPSRCGIPTQSTGSSAAVWSSAMNHGNGPGLESQANFKQEEGEEECYNHAGNNHDEMLQSLTTRGAPKPCQALTDSKPLNYKNAKKHPEAGLPWSCDQPGCGRAYAKTGS